LAAILEMSVKGVDERDPGVPRGNVSYSAPKIVFAHPAGAIVVNAIGVNLASVEASILSPALHPKHSGHVLGKGMSVFPSLSPWSL
jgi:hypothetical protein